MFTHLHVHTEYSMLDGLSRIEPLVNQAVDLGMHSLAITDHGGMYGVVDFFQTAKKSGIKPIIGSEIYVAHKSRYDRNPSEKIHHLTVLAKNNVGYKNLVKLITDANLQGYYRRPRADRELLEKYSEGLIILSGCPSGEVPWLTAQERFDDAINAAAWYKDVFKDDYYLEIMQHGDVPELPQINQSLVSISKDLNIPLVATNDSHYIKEEHAKDHDALLCIQTNTNIHDPNRMRFEEHSYHLRSHEEMVNLFSELPEAISNTELIAEKCELNLDFTQVRLPEFKVPDGMSSHEYLTSLCWKGYEEKINNPSSIYEERMKYELEVIKQTQFPDYFLVVWDIALFVRKNNIFFTVRGSAAASLVLYCLGVTDVDPMQYKLVFERFLNLERKEMPDIDMDFQDDRRQEVINYCASRYGREHVAHIITFGRFGARQSIRDAGRALGIPLPNVDRIAKMIPEKLNITLNDSLNESVELKEAYESNTQTKDLIDSARQLEGVTRHKSLHAAGVVISKEPLNDVVPLEYTSRGDSEGAVMTQYAMEPVAALGLLKMDFLGLMNLTVLDESLRSISQNYGVDLTLHQIPVDDQPTFDLLSRGETVGVFQLESSGMTRYIKELKPTSIGDVAAMIALFRPGPMEHISTFIEGKHGTRQITYLHEALKEILEETYGVIVFQDQVLHIAREFAGYTLGKADILRKAMGKKVPEIMAEEKDKFISGAIDKGYTQELASSVFDLVEPFAGYAFNKAHSVSYGLVSYWTAYMKANFPSDYMCAFMNSYIDKKDRLIAAVADCRRMGIEILPPDINESHSKFTIEDQGKDNPSIRFGLSAIKNVGAEAVNELIESRKENGRFSSLGDLCRNGDLKSINRKALECMIMAGGFDEFGDRTSLLDSIEKILSIAQSEANLRNSTQTTMFEMLDENDEVPITEIQLPFASTSDHQKRVWEVELMGISVSTANQLASLLSRVDSKVKISLSQIQEASNNGRSKVAGQVATVLDRFTRDNRPFKVITLEMIDGSVEAVAWEDTLKTTQNIWNPGSILEITGSIRERNNEYTINVSDASEFNVDELLKGKQKHSMEEIQNNSQTKEEKPIELNGTSNDLNGAPKKGLLLKLKESGDINTDGNLMENIKQLLLSNKGSDDVTFEIETQETYVTLDWPIVKVDASPELESKLNEMLGESGSVLIQSKMF